MKSINGLMDGAIEALYRGDFRGAEELCRQALSLKPDHAEALHILGLACGQQGKLEEATSFIRQSVINAPENHLYHFNLAYLL